MPRGRAAECRLRRAPSIDAQHGPDWQAKGSFGAIAGRPSGSGLSAGHLWSSAPGRCTLLLWCIFISLLAQGRGARRLAQSSFAGAWLGYRSACGDDNWPALGIGTRPDETQTDRRGGGTGGIHALSVGACNTSLSPSFSRISKASCDLHGLQIAARPPGAAPLTLMCGVRTIRHRCPQDLASAPERVPE